MTYFRNEPEFNEEHFGRLYNNPVKSYGRKCVFELFSVTMKWIFEQYEIHIRMMGNVRGYNYDDPLQSEMYFQ